MVSFAVLRSRKIVIRNLIHANFISFAVPNILLILLGLPSLWLSEKREEMREKYTTTMFWNMNKIRHGELHNSSGDGRHPSLVIHIYEIRRKVD